MKNIILFITLLIFGNCGFAQIQSPIAPPDSSIVDEILIVEVMPSWPGCENLADEDKRSNCTFQKLQEFLAMYTIYPSKSKDKNTQGVVYVSFTITETGKCVDHLILRGVSPELDAEALRVIKGFPDWNPGFTKTKTVRVQYTVPVKFTLR